MTADRIAHAVAGGLAFVCATCRKYWQGQDNNLGRCTANQRCCSPLGGMTFPEYDGLLTPERFADWCFVCGVASEHGVVLPGHKHVCGLCAQHLSFLERVVARDVANICEGMTLRTTVGEMSVVRLFKRTKRTFLEEVYEVEKYFAEKEGRL